ncbi:hypothetical protein D3C87_1377360 [compost metagenome]
MTTGMAAMAVTIKIARQPQASSKMPPSTGDSPNPAMPAADQTLIADASLPAGVCDRSSTSADGDNRAAKAP